MITISTFVTDSSESPVRVELSVGAAAWNFTTAFCPTCAAATCPRVQCWWTLFRVAACEWYLQLKMTRNTSGLRLFYSWCALKRLQQFFSSLMNCIQFFCSLHWKWGSEFPFFITQFQYTSSSKRTLYLYHTITLSRRSTRARVSLSTRSPVTDNRSGSVGRAVCLRPRQGANWGDSALCPVALLARGETASTQSGASRERATSRLPTSQPQCRICGGCDSRPFLKLQTRYARCSLYLPSRVFSLKTINKISRKWRWKKGKYTNDDSLFDASSLPVMN